MPHQMRKVKALFFNLIRPLFVANIDPNEDFDCIICVEPVLRRQLVCSQKCYDKFCSIKLDLQ